VDDVSVSCIAKHHPGLYKRISRDESLMRAALAALFERVSAVARGWSADEPVLDDEDALRLYERALRFSVDRAGHDLRRSLRVAERRVRALRPGEGGACPVCQHDVDRGRRLPCCGAAAHDDCLVVAHVRGTDRCPLCRAGDFA